MGGNYKLYQYNEQKRWQLLKGDNPKIVYSNQTYQLNLPKGKFKIISDNSYPYLHNSTPIYFTIIDNGKLKVENNNKRMNLKQQDSTIQLTQIMEKLEISKNTSMSQVTLGEKSQIVIKSTIPAFIEDYNYYYLQDRISKENFTYDENSVEVYGDSEKLIEKQDYNTIVSEDEKNIFLKIFLTKTGLKKSSQFRQLIVTYTGGFKFIKETMNSIKLDPVLLHYDNNNGDRTDNIQRSPLMQKQQRSDTEESYWEFGDDYFSQEYFNQFGQCLDGIFVPYPFDTIKIVDDSDPDSDEVFYNDLVYQDILESINKGENLAKTRIPSAIAILNGEMPGFNELNIIYLKYVCAGNPGGQTGLPIGSNPRFVFTSAAVFKKVDSQTKQGIANAKFKITRRKYKQDSSGIYIVNNGKLIPEFDSTGEQIRVPMIWNKELLIANKRHSNRFENMELGNEIILVSSDESKYLGNFDLIGIEPDSEVGEMGYQLEEISAPEGYEAKKEPISVFAITKEQWDKEIKPVPEDWVVDNLVDQRHRTEIENSKSAPPEVPATGGVGTLWITGISTFILGIGVYYVIYLKNNF